jgi:hypothetical protein
VRPASPPLSARWWCASQRTVVARAARGRVVSPPLSARWWCASQRTVVARAARGRVVPGGGAGACAASASAASAQYVVPPGARESVFRSVEQRGGRVPIASQPGSWPYPPSYVCGARQQRMRRDDGKARLAWQAWIYATARGRSTADQSRRSAQRTSAQYDSRRSASSEPGVVAKLNMPSAAA